MHDFMMQGRGRPQAWLGSMLCSGRAQCSKAFRAPPCVQHARGRQRGAPRALRALPAGHRGDGLPAPASSGAQAGSRGQRVSAAPPPTVPAILLSLGVSTLLHCKFKARASDGRWLRRLGKLTGWSNVDGLLKLLDSTRFPLC